jgi:hypothetical protein
MRPFRVMLVLLAGSLVSLGIAYGVTRLLLREDRLIGSAKGFTVEQANELRLLGNQLLELAELLERQMALTPGRPLQDWLKLGLAPRLQHYRKTLQAHQALPYAPRTHLEAGLEALQRSTRGANTPEELRAAVAQARQGWAETERFISRMNVEGRLAAPKRRVD